MVAQPTVTSKVLEAACEYLCVQEVCEKSEEVGTGKYLFAGFLLGIIFTFAALAWIEYGCNSIARGFQTAAEEAANRRRVVQGSAIG